MRALYSLKPRSYLENECKNSLEFGKNRDDLVARSLLVFCRTDVLVRLKFPTDADVHRTNGGVDQGKCMGIEPTGPAFSDGAS